MLVTTIKQPDEWMAAHCYNNGYGIGHRNIHEGYGLEEWNGSYSWYYTERGKRDYLIHFSTEREAVTYAYNIISTDRFAARHLVGLIKTKVEAIALLTALKHRNIKFWTDEIPYGGPNNRRTRVFVFGCDLKKVLDLKEKYHPQ